MRSFISDSSATPRPKPKAEGRRPVAKEGASQMDRRWPTYSRICAGKGVGHSFVGEAASGRRCGELGFLWDGELRDRSPANGLELGKGR